MKKRICGIILAASLVAGMLGGCGKSSEKKNEQGNSGIQSEANDRTADLYGPEASPDWVTKLPEAATANQLFVVAGIGKTTAYVSMHQKNDDGTWTQIMTTPGYIGKNGLGKTKEGDGMTPVGTFSFNYAFGIAADPGCAIPYQQVTYKDYWSGDQRDGYHYNEMVNIDNIPDLSIDDSEHIVDYPYQYQYCLNISYNATGEKEAGSAIFLHCLGPIKPYTGGCVAIPQDQMITVLKNVSPDCVVVIDSLKNLSPELWEEYGLGTADSSDDSENTDVTLSDDSSDFVNLSEAVPDAILEIRYYSTYNFMGQRVAGYEEPEAFLTKEAAAALKEVSDELVEKGYRLKIYDAYRPQMAVTDFVNWAKDLEDTEMKEYFYPELEKDVIFPQGYIMEHSGHSRGSTVDLTLF